MKIFTLAPSENWICDRFAEEWKRHAAGFNTNDPMQADIIWLLADWCWNQVNPYLLMQKKVVASVHHITPDKFDENEKTIFATRDQFIDAYHVPCLKTKDQIKDLTTKPIYTFPFWVNQEMWKNKRSEKLELRKKYNLPENLGFVKGVFSIVKGKFAFVDGEKESYFIWRRNLEMESSKFYQFWFFSRF